MQSNRYPFPMPFGWFSVGYAEDFPSGAAKAIYYFDQHLVAWRDETGEMHVQDAFCPHLGAHLGHGGKVEGCELRCPFHGWKFDAEGTNTDIPYSDRVNRKAQLRTYPVAERNGFVLAWYHPDDKPPSWDVEEVPSSTPASSPARSAPTTWSTPACRRWARTRPTRPTSATCTTPRPSPRSSTTRPTGTARS